MKHFWQSSTYDSARINLLDSLDSGIDQDNHYFTEGNCLWSEEELEPVTKSLDELEVNDVVEKKDGRCKLILGVVNRNGENTIYVTSEWEKCNSKKEIEHFKKIVGEIVTAYELKIDGYTPYTPKKIKVVKIRGKSYPVTEIIKNVKSL